MLKHTGQARAGCVAGRKPVHRNRRCLNARQPASGFTLIEVVISVLVLLVGLLGVVGMQMLSFQTNQGAYFRSQATYMASEILDAMRANPTALADYDGTYPDDGVPADQGCDGAAGCAPPQAASQDIREWSAHFTDVYGVGAAAFRPSLPNGRATITTSTAPEVTVQVVWTERQFDGSSGAAERERVNQQVLLTANIVP
ncbi:MAG: type IV pilus modification protein PilV [Pseudomonadota bacterium]